MFVRTPDDVIAAGRLKELQGGDTRSARYLTAADGMGFSFHVNRCQAAPAHLLWYKHHWEANYIISGKVKVTDLTSGESWLVEAGDLYQVGPNDRHYFEVLEDDQHVSVFCPALHGDETHDADGSYSASGPVPESDRRMFVKRVGEMRANGEEMVVANGGARTVRALTAADGMGVQLLGCRILRRRGGGSLVQAPLGGELHPHRHRSRGRPRHRVRRGRSRPARFTTWGRRTATASPPRPTSTLSACFARRFAATSSTTRTVRSSRAGRCRRGLPDTDGRFAMTSAFAATTPVSWCVASR